MTDQTAPTVVFTERLAILDTLTWTVADNLSWALTDHCIHAALDAGAITDQTECHVVHAIDGLDFVLSVVLD